MKKRMTAVAVGLVLAAGAFGTSVPAHANSDRVDQSACEVAREAKAVAIIVEASKDTRGGKAERAESRADLTRAAFVVSTIESACEPNEGTHDNGDGEGGDS